jgi:hypothetical protein
VAGVFGRVYDTDTGDGFVPKPTVTLSPKGGAPVVGPLSADDDGYYLLEYKHKGKPALYTVEVVGVPGCDPYQQDVTLKGNGYCLVDFKADGAGSCLTEVYCK